MQLYNLLLQQNTLATDEVSRVEDWNLDESEFHNYLRQFLPDPACGLRDFLTESTPNQVEVCRVYQDNVSEHIAVISTPTIYYQYNFDSIGQNIISTRNH